MKVDKGYTTWDYADGPGATETVYNANGPGVHVPDSITAKDGVTVLQLDLASASHKGKGWTPPDGMRQVTARWTEPKSSLNPFVPLDRQRWTSPGRSRGRCCRACSMHCTQLACNGTGKPTSSPI